VRLVPSESGAGTEVILRVDARAGRLLNLWSDGFDTARAERLRQAAAGWVGSAVPELGLHMLLLRLRLDVLLTAWAHLEVVAAACVLDEVIVGGSAGAIARLIDARAGKVDGLLELWFNRVHFAAVTLWLQDAVAERVWLLLHLSDEHRLGGRAAGGVRAGGVGRDRSELILRRAGDLHGAWRRATRGGAERAQQATRLAQDREGLQKEEGGDKQSAHGRSQKLNSLLFALPRGWPWQ